MVPTLALCVRLEFRTEIGSEGGAEYRITFEDVTNSGDVALLVAHSEGLTGAGSTVVAREVGPYRRLPIGGVEQPRGKSSAASIAEAANACLVRFT